MWGGGVCRFPITNPGSEDGAARAPASPGWTRAHGLRAPLMNWRTIHQKRGQSFRKHPGNEDEVGDLLGSWRLEREVAKDQRGAPPAPRASLGWGVRRGQL